MNFEMLDTESTIVAPATAMGGAVMVVRLSGSRAIEIADRMFRGRKPLSDAEGYTLHYGTIVGGDGEVVDDVVVALFRAPRSFTGEDTVEITLHGSQYITSRVLHLAIEHGARMSTAGEFTRRAFLAGKMDLSRAEAVADVIASDSAWSHRVATTQMRGGYSARLATLRDRLLHLCSLLELELDFSEEDVEFADRKMLRSIIDEVSHEIESLTSSFSLGNAIKEGVAVAIVGEPNVGKSTLLNALVEDDRAMVSEIAGTTRDTVEATAVIDGIRFRFIDAAGLRTTDDRLESMGIERTRRAMSEAHVILHLAAADNPRFEPVSPAASQRYIRVINKIDKLSTTPDATTSTTTNAESDATTLTPTNTESDAATLLHISARHGVGIERLRSVLRSTVDTASIDAGDVVVSNMRHYAALRSAHDSLRSAMTSMERNLPADLLSEELRQTLHHLGEITGEITSDDILHSIFSKFCIGK